MPPETIDHLVRHALWLGIGVLLTLAGTGALGGRRDGRRLYLVIGIVIILTAVVVGLATWPG